jgi:penicillin-binding protein 1C
VTPGGGPVQAGCPTARTRALAVAGLLARIALALPAAGHAQTAAIAQAAQAPLPRFEAVRAAHTPSDATLLDRHGTPIQTLRVDARVRRGAWLALADVSPALRQAIVLSEDRRFWDHGGVDWAALGASAWASAWNTRTRGASTVTMQLAGLLDDSLARPGGGRSPAQKLGQIVRAQQLEGAWTKTQILEAYLNQVPLRGELVGVAAASQVLFGKHASGLDATESALLAALLRGPNADAATLERRGCELLRQQRQACAGLGTTIAQALVRRPGTLGGEQIAPHFMRAWAARSRPPEGSQAAPGALWRSTLDAPTQRVAIAALRQQLGELQGRNVEDGAVLVLDNASGEVLAWVGSSGTASQAADVDAVLARRQPGSTIKPFIYALALQQRLVTAASRLDDSPLQLSAGGALYRPQNYDHAYRGAVSVRAALAGSLNVPAVRVGAMLGPEAVFEHLNRAGLRLAETAGYHGQALALGSADVSLLDLSNAYRALAQGGQWRPVRWQAAAPAAAAAGRAGVSAGVGVGAGPSAGVSAGVSAGMGSGMGTGVGSGAGANAEGRRLVDPATAFIVADILADPAARAITFGLDSPLVTRGWAAVKTGTSKDLRDNWCIGFTTRYTVGVWVGNASGAPMHGVSGVSGAAPVWRAVVAHLHAREPARAPAAPAGLVAQGGEWFVSGTVPDTRLQAAAAARFGISSPREGSIVVLDPEIPMAAQRMVFEGAAGEWFVAGRSVGKGSLVRWLPRPGRHLLERRSADGSVVDRVRFEVRAAPPRWAPQAQAQAHAHAPSAQQQRAALRPGS